MKLTPRNIIHAGVLLAAALTSMPSLAQDGELPIAGQPPADGLDRFLKGFLIESFKPHAAGQMMFVQRYELAVKLSSRLIVTTNR